MRTQSGAGFGRNGTWRGRLNTAESSRENSDADDTVHSRPSSVASNDTPVATTPQAGARGAALTSPQSPSRVVRIDGAGTPTADTDGKDHVGTKPLLAILGEAAFLFFMNDTLQDSDPAEVTLRKLTIASTFPMAVVAGLGGVIVTAVEMYNPSALLVLLACIVSAVAHTLAFIQLHRSKEAPLWLTGALAAADFTAAVLAEIGNPGYVGVYIAVYCYIWHARQAPPVNHIVLVASAAALVWDGYNNVAARVGWPVAGVDTGSSLLGVLFACGGGVAIACVLVAHTHAMARQRRAEAKRDQEDAVIKDAVEALQRFDTQAIDAVLARATESQIRQSHQDVLSGIAEAVARYRPHIPHYVLDAAVLASITVADPQGSASSPGATEELRSMKSARHHRRADLRSSGAETGSSIRGGRAGSIMADNVSSRSRVSKYASAADDVGSVVSRRSDIAGAGSVAGIQASPLYLARTRPIVHRRITVAHLEFFVPNEFATTRAFALLVDHILNKASEYEASVHTLVGDIAIVSWNAVKSVTMAEYLACSFCSDVLKFVRHEFAKKVLSSSASGTRNVSTSAIRAAMDFSLSAAPGMPRATGAIVTGDSRVCFAGSTSYEFCMSLPQMQPILLEYRRFAAARNMLCVDAMTRNGAGRGIKVRGVDMLTVARRSNLHAFRPHPYGSHGPNGSSGDHGGHEGSPGLAVAPPLVELAKSPGVRHGLGDSSVTGQDPDDTAFDIIIYEVTQVTQAVDGAPYSARSGQSGGANASIRTGNANAAMAINTAAPTINTFDAGDEDGLGLALALEAPSASGAFGRSPSNRYGGQPPSLSIMAAGSKSATAELDPDDLLTKGLSLAGVERRYMDAARRFNEAIEVLEKRIAEARRRPPQPRAAEADPDHDSVSMHVPSAPATADDMGAMFRRDTPSGEYARVEDVSDNAPPEQLAVLTNEQLLQVATGLYNRALRAHDTQAKYFGIGIVYVQAP
eukprot:CAMPEP_0174832358 /NCGR_PEP_ID=MMETSP1114-20130205/3630_1 /TAXON_ID=312471 /ORGANISM="Neobodo designis, Strain CCAP 1951/1" /LENGTH=975 /DNA_ID=CAMNT_0016066215 /DNA_START=171 /DNA_END=3098 /DNA_ORIENTATION=+